MSGTDRIELVEPSPRAAVESWVLAVFLIGGFIVAVAAYSYAIQSIVVYVASAASLVTYGVESAIAPWPGRRFLRVPTSVWLNLALLLLIGVLSMLYNKSNQPIGTVHSMRTDLDAHMPVVPLFTVPYLGFFLIYPLTVGWFAFHRLDRQLRTGIGALAVSLVVGLTTFVIFQTFVEKPAIEGDGLFWYLLHYIEEQVYAGQYYSTFPSLHCALTTVFGIMWVRAVGRDGLWWRKVAAVTYVLLVIAATQLLHMHVILDAIYGVMLAFGAYAVSWWAFESRRRPAHVA